MQVLEYAPFKHQDPCVQIVGDPYLESWRHLREIELKRHRRGTLMCEFLHDLTPLFSACDLVFDSPA